MTSPTIKKYSKSAEQYVADYEKIRHKYKLYFVAGSVKCKEAKKLRKQLEYRNKTLNQILQQSMSVLEDGGRGMVFAGRRVFPQLFAHNVVGVQPMTTPAGLAYAMRFLTSAITSATPAI